MFFKKIFFNNYNIFCIGDEDSLSFELIQYLASRGAHNFILVSKNKLLSGYQSLVLRRLKNKNVKIVISISDPLTVKGAEDLLREAILLGPVSGIYHISTVSTFKHYLMIYKVNLKQFFV